MSAGHDHLLPTTEDLVVRARRHDAAAFTELIRRYERVVLSVAFAVTGDGDSAGDVVQEAYLRAWERLTDLKEPARFSTWLCGIARNLAIDMHRKRRRMKTSIDAVGVDAIAMADEHWSPDPLDEIDRREKHELVGKALQSLDDLTRPAVILRYYDGLSSKEIGETLGLSPAAVDMRLSRGRQQLKILLASASHVN